MPYRSLSKAALITDQSVFFRALVAKLVGRCGYSAVVARSGAELVRLIPSRRPGLIITDAALPDISGVDVILRIRQASAEIGNIPLIVFSTSERPDDQRCFLDAGASGVVAKAKGINGMLDVLVQVAPSILLH